jgi:arylsulfatase A
MRTVLFSLLASLPLFAAETPPNVVVIFIDDMGYADVGCFGAEGYTTPNIDRLAKEGRRFTNFHVAQPVCSASRAALLTGCYPNRIGIHGALGPKVTHGIADGETTLGELFRSKGYATAAIGKWHLGHHPQFLPTHNGFDEYLGLPYSNDMWPLHPDYIKLPPDAPNRMAGYPALPMIDGDRIIDPEVTSDDQRQLTTRYTERAVSFIERGKDKPFFLYLAHSMCHVPLFVSDKFAGKSKRGLFGDVIMEIDWSVGQVMNALEKNGLTENTIVIFTSDNGPWLNFGDHAGSAKPLREGKGTCWEGGTRVPCVMRWPGRIAGGGSCDDMLMTIDLFPTFAKLIGEELPSHKIDGLDVAPILLGKPGATNPHEAYFSYYNQNELHAVTSGDGHWKLYLPHTYRTLAGKPGGTGGKPVNYQMEKLAKPELYDLKNDRSETADVSAQHPDIVEQLMKQAELARADLGDTLTKREGSGNRAAGQLDK